MDNILHVPQGEFELNRLPFRKKELLRAWDAADEYVLDYLAEHIDFSGKRLLIINDAFGALAVALHSYQPEAVSDSYLSQQATRQNLVENHLQEEDVRLLTSLQMPEKNPDLVIIKSPKTLAFLEDILIRLKPILTAQTKVIVAGMMKNMPSTVWQMLEKLCGPTTTSLAKKKAKLIFVTPELSMKMPENPYPVKYKLEGTDYIISNHANVFSRDRLDIGTRFFLQHLPVETGFKDIVDLGCGNGVVGLMAAQLNTDATVYFVDESFMAVASAQENFQRAFAGNRKAVFRVGNGLEKFSANSADLVLCNPPFHQQNTVGDQIAVTMFKQAKKVLNTSGQLWVIGNRHLKYHLTLKKWFNTVDVAASNTKFIIYKCQN